MEENQSCRQPAATSSRLGMRAASGAAAGGEIVEVQGGHIVRSTGRKDRHSKVCTAKGPRDRRVRLSAHTAIQFYDVQDRLGYDRPSKAVDWLIRNAKAAIDELAELPAWKPTTGSATTSSSNPSAAQQNDNAENQLRVHRVVDTVASGSSNRRRTAMVGSEGRVVQNQNFQIGDTQGNHCSSFLPPSLDSDAIADTIKSFFPMGASAETSSEIQFQSYPLDLLSRSSSQSQDLRLSLQSFQDPMLQPHHGEQNLFFGANPLGYDGYQPVSEMGRLQRIVGWNSGADSGNASNGDGGNGGFVFNSPAPPQLQPFFSGQNQFFSQRGPLQSSNTPSVRAWIDPGITTTATTTTSQYQVPPFMHHQSSMSGIGFALGGFPGFNIPARIQGEEEHDGMSNKPSSASSDSRH